MKYTILTILMAAGSVFTLGFEGPKRLRDSRNISRGLLPRGACIGKFCGPKTPPQSVSTEMIPQSGSTNSGRLSTPDSSASLLHRWTDASRPTPGPTPGPMPTDVLRSILRIAEDGSRLERTSSSNHDRRPPTRLNRPRRVVRTTR